MNDKDLTWTRALNRHADTVLGAVWQMPEILEGYPDVPLSPLVTSLASRAACLGRVPGSVAAALLVPLNPEIVERAVNKAWRASSPEELVAKRRDAVGAHLHRIAGDLAPTMESTAGLLAELVARAPAEGHPMFAALRSLDPPDDMLTRVWWLCDALRERRGDSHRNAWVTAGLSGCEIAVMTELRDGIELGTTSRQHLGWTDPDVTAAIASLGRRGYVEGTGLTPTGSAAREAIEVRTDEQEAWLDPTEARHVIGHLRPLSRRVHERGTIAW